MTYVKLIEKIAHLLEELVYLIAIIGYKIYQYRWLVLSLTILAVIFLGGLIGYGYRVSQL